MTDQQTTSKAAEAVRRGLQRRQDAAQNEVSRLIETGRELFGSGANPRVSDIVKAAGVSNEAFYRYFGSKVEFASAVAEDGSRRVLTYVEHKMAGIDDPAKRLRAGIAALMSQAARPELATAARNILGRSAAAGHVDTNSIEPALADLLGPTLTDLGCTDLARDAQIVAITLVGVLQGHVWGETQPSGRDLDHLTAFVAAAVRPGRP